VPQLHARQPAGDQQLDDNPMCFTVKYTRWVGLEIGATFDQLECGPMPNVMVALPNIGGALCSTPQSLSDAHYLTAVQ